MAERLQPRAGRSVFSKIRLISLSLILLASTIWFSLTPGNMPISIAAVTLGNFILTLFALFSVFLTRPRRADSKNPTKSGGTSQGKERVQAGREEEFLHRSLKILKILGVVGLVAILFSGSLALIVNSPLSKPAPISDSSSILLSAASLALFIFSSLVGIAAIFGWQQLQRDIDVKVREYGMNYQLESQKKFADIENELRGRSASLIGFMLGELSIDYSGARMRVVREDLLRDSVHYCQEGFRRLKDSNDPGPRLLSINNYLYYYSLANPKSGNPSILRYVDELLAVGQENDKIHLQLTYCRIVALFSKDSKQRREAKEVVNDLIENKNLDRRQTKEAEGCLDLL
ncbi:MAG TPA: hypothetical protein VGS22_21970 [Thermoanaerobaculia bacterium]|jgi:hypothetical protein|nr:hypothetical protein [Thermoanaerobaculia bacterium]